MPRPKTRLAPSPVRRKPAPVTVTKLPTVRCETCKQTMAVTFGSASEILTDHYRQVHPTV